MPPRPSRLWEIAVICDAFAPATDRALPDTGLGNDADQLARLAGLAATAVPLLARHANELAEQIHQLPPTVAAVWLTRTRTPRARATQRLLATTERIPVITDDDAIAISLSAATHTYLSRLPGPAATARILIAHVAECPTLHALLSTNTDGHDRTTQLSHWSPTAASQPLARAASDADVIINLLGPHPTLTDLAARRPQHAVISLRGEQEHLLPLPGLFRALATQPPTPLNLATLRACVQGLIAATQPGQLLPSLYDPTLTYHVTHHVTTALQNAPTHSTHTTE
jgi:hypothetical protein